MVVLRGKRFAAHTSVLTPTSSAAIDPRVGRQNTRAVNLVVGLIVTLSQKLGIFVLGHDHSSIATLTKDGDEGQIIRLPLPPLHWLWTRKIQRRNMRNVQASPPRMPNGAKIPLRRHTLPDVETYDVTADELATIEIESKNVGQDFQYCSICLTAAIAFTVAIFTTEIKSQRTFDIFVILAVCGSVFSVYFYQRYRRGKKKSFTTIQKVRERQVGPIGEEGHELKPVQVAQLPVVTGPPPAPAIPPQPLASSAGAQIQSDAGNGSITE